nr:transmembrane protein adipocyte-associated 1 homolog [Ipomoea batatas]
MSGTPETLFTGQASSPTASVATASAAGNHFISRWYSSSANACRGFWHDAALIVPSILFILYLGFHAKRNIKKLKNRGSYVMIAYYALLWFATLVNFAWSSLQAWQCAPGKDVAWNLLSLFAASGMLCLEISLLSFLLHENYATGLETLTRTFFVSGLFVGVDVLLKVILVFGFRIPLFVDVGLANGGKWAIWFTYRLLLTAAYGYIYFVHFSKWRDNLPPRPAFYNYVIVMFATNVAVLFACGLGVFGIGFGTWLYDLSVVCYHSLYLPFIYATFLADFFQEEDWLLDEAYYSEMKDAGFFDADWE